MTPPSVHTPEDYQARLVEITEELIAARQRVQVEVGERNAAVEALAKHLAVPDGEERIAVVGGYVYEVGRRGDQYAATVKRVHAVVD